MLRKKHLLAIAVSTFIATGANAAPQTGVYIGGLLGWGTTNHQNVSQDVVNDNLNAFPSQLSDDFFIASSGSSKNTIDNGGVAGRLFIGYQFNHYLGAELGYSKFSDSNTSANGLAVAQVYGYSLDQISASDSEYASVNFSTYAVDLVAKLTAPLSNNFDLYAKVGVAYLNQKGNVNEAYSESAQVLGVVVASGGDAYSFKTSASGYYPTFGLGAAYEINKNLTADVSWMHIQVSNNNDDSSRLINNTDMVGLGLMYSFS
jgi:hypothetical protein